MRPQSVRKKKRLIIETTVDNKVALENLLVNSGVTLTDWFNARVAEAIVPYSVNRPSIDKEIETLSELKEPHWVLENLNEIGWGFEKENTGYLTHDIHPYPAKFIPQIPAHLIPRLSLRGEFVCDPFGGSGTTALEAILLGRQCMSIDVNPLAEVIGIAKTLTLIKEQEDLLQALCERLLFLANSERSVIKVIDEAWHSIKDGVPLIPNIDDWFHNYAIRELAYLKASISHLNSEECRAVARAAFSRTVLKASYQDGETRYARRFREVVPGFVFKCFAYDLATILGKIRQVSSLLQFRRPTFITADLRNPIVGEGIFFNHQQYLKPNSVDLIITSPPYPNANDYHLYHRFRLFWLGFDPRNLAKAEIGSHLRHQKEGTGFKEYLQEIKPCLDNCFKALRPGRYAVFVLGDAIFNGKVYSTVDEIGKVAEEIGFDLIGAIERQIHRTKRSFIPPARRAKEEKLLLLRKPNKKIEVMLKEAPYKLWSYEKGLRKREIVEVVGCEPAGINNHDWSIELDSLEIDRLRRLTFTHGITSPDVNRLSTWQAILENGDAFSTTSSKKDPKYVTHGIHPYKGKFYPQLAKALFNLANLKAGQTVLDPYCGSGTVLLEGQLNGLTPYGCDINPLAVKIARSKTQILSVDPYILDRLLARFLENIKNGSEDDIWLNYFPQSCHEEILNWFPRPVANKLGWLFTEIQNVPNEYVQEFLQIIASSTVREVSHQDPRDLRIRRRESLLKDAPVFEMFSKVLIEQRRRLQHFAESLKECPYKLLSPTIWDGDSRQLDTFISNGLKENSVDAVVTSPPYATALPYIDTDRLSILLLFGMTSRERSPLEEKLIGSREISIRDRNEVDKRIGKEDWDHIQSNMACALIKQVYTLNANTNVGFRRKNMASLLYRYFRDMTITLKNINRLVRSSGQMFFVIGDNYTLAGGKDIHINTTDILRELGNDLGWYIKDSIPITVTRENVKHAKNAITENTVLWFQKP